MRHNKSGPLQRWWALLLLTLAVLLATAAPASAHTGFESATPSDGQTANQPLTEISLVFSGEATPSGEGFVVLDPSGQIRQPDEITSADNLTWVLRFDEPLAGGVVGVRWEVAAPDAHPIDGSFSFTVAAEVPPATTTTQPTAPESSEVGAAAPTSSSEISADATAPDPDEGQTAESAAQTNVETSDLESFLETDDNKATGAAWLLGLSRAMRSLGAVGAIGGTAFATFALRGHKRDVRAVVDWVRRAGALLILGAVLTGVAQLATLGSGWEAVWSPSAWTDTLWSSLGVAIMLRLVGGGLIATGTNLHTTLASAGSDAIVATKQLASVGAGSRVSVSPASNHPERTEPFVYQGDHAWKPSASPAALVGLALILLSFINDGHTVSEGPRWLHALTNMTHVLTAATWAGGVAMLALVISRRRRNGVNTRSLQLAVRFSVVATVALIGAAIAGVVIPILILDSPSQLWSTSWGRLLIVKVALVGIAAAGGAYNHKVIVPQLERSPEDTVVADKFRKVVTIEAVALLAVTVITALLVGASST